VGRKKPGARAKRKMLLQHARVVVRDEGYRQGVVSQQLWLLWLHAPSRCKLLSSNIPKKVAQGLDGGVVLC
jgi:hypothetical protein